MATKESIFRTAMNSNFAVVFSDEDQQKLKGYDSRLKELRIELGKRNGDVVNYQSKVDEANRIGKEAKALNQRLIDGHADFQRATVLLRVAAINSLKSGELIEDDLGISISLSASAPIYVEFANTFSRHTKSLNDLRVMLATFKAIRKSTSVTDSEFVSKISGSFNTILRDLNLALTKEKLTIAKAGLPWSRSILPKYLDDDLEAFLLHFILTDIKKPLALVGSTTLLQRNSSVMSTLAAAINTARNSDMFSDNAISMMLENDSSQLKENGVDVYSKLGLFLDEPNTYDRLLLDEVFSGKILPMSFWGSSNISDACTNLGYLIDNLNMERVEEAYVALINVTYALFRGRSPLTIEVGSDQLYYL